MDITPRIAPYEPKLWRHKKTGELYYIVDYGTDETSGAPVVIYESISDHANLGRLWIRSKEEFFDGRFEAYHVQR